MKPGCDPTPWELPYNNPRFQPWGQETYTLLTLLRVSQKQKLIMLLWVTPKGVSFRHLTYPPDESGGYSQATPIGVGNGS